MIENFAETIHGTLLSVYGIGVLVRGESGTGKSDCALEMLSRGHRLVSDDVVKLERVGSTLYGSAPAILNGLLEIRGVGICDIRQIFGQEALTGRCMVDISIEFKAEKSAGQTERLGNDRATIGIMGVRLPHFVISDSNNRPLSVIVEAAVKDAMPGGRRAELELIENYNASLIN